MGVRSSTAALLLAALLLVGGCVAPDGRGAASTGPAERDAIVIASFNFTESRLLAELYAQVLAAAGYPVASVLELGSRETVEPALEQGHVDIVPEYTGSALNFLERRPDAADADASRTHARLRDAFAARGITVASPAPAENQNAFAVRDDTAEDLGLRTVSDLRAVSGELTLGGPPECPQRPTCLRGLRAVYDLDFGHFVGLEQASHVAAALVAGEIDVGLLFTTDPALTEHGFVALEDDRALQPAENVVPVVRSAVLERHGRGVLAALDEVSRELTTLELARLNQRVDAGGEQVEGVARDWLSAHGIRR